MKRLLKFLRCALLSFVGAALMLLVPATGATEVDAGSALPSYEELPAQAPDKALLKPLAAKSLKGRFEERRTLPGFPKPMVTTGVFELTGKTLRWEAEKPFPSIMIAGPDGVLMEAAGERQVLSAADIPAVGRASELLSGVFSGNFAALKEAFDLRAEKLADGSVRIAARPKSPELAKVLGEVRAKGRSFVERIEVVSAQGRAEILFSDVRVGND